MPRQPAPANRQTPLNLERTMQEKRRRVSAAFEARAPLDRDQMRLSLGKPCEKDLRMDNVKDCSAVMTTIYREQIEAGDVKVVLAFLKSLCVLEPEAAELNILRRLQSNIGIFVDGYNDDSRELFQISEVRSYFQKLHSVWPYGLYFFNRELRTLQLLVLCHVEPKFEPNPQSGELVLRVPADQVATFLRASAPPTLSVAARLEWPQELGTQFYREIAADVGVLSEDRAPIRERLEERRQRHLDFVKSQKQALAELARNGYQEEGRGGLIVVPPEPGQSGCGVMFVNQAGLVTETQTTQMAKLVERYDPETQFVVCFREPGSPSSPSYIVKAP
jgi:hypothetical protein